MKRPAIGYAETGDGVSIAFSVVGDGPVTLVMLSPLIAQLEVAWEEPAFEHFVTRLAGCSRVILYDRRGTGLSDRATASGERLSLHQLVTDLIAVLDAVPAERVVLFGASLGGQIAIQFGADQPQRCDAMIIYASSARLPQLEGFDFSQTDQIDRWADHVARAWGSGASVEAEAPAMVDDDRYRQWAARLERHTCPPGMLAASLRRIATFDVRPVLSTLDCPTLVLHRVGDDRVPVSEGRYLAEHIPGAVFSTAARGRAHLLLGDHRSLVAAMVRFLDQRLTNGVLAAALRQAERSGPYESGWQSLTPAEREITGLVASGMTNSEVAARLNLSRHTIDGRLRRVFAKLDISSRVELTAEYARVSR